MSNWQDYYEEDDSDEQCFENLESLGGEEDDTATCCYCGEVIFRFGGDWVCDSCGPLSDEELEEE